MVAPMTRWSPLPAALLSLAFVMDASGLEGQTFLPDAVDETTFAFQWEKPFIPDSDGLAALSSIFEADAIFPVSPGTSIRIGLPLVIAGGEFVDGTSVYVGNLRASLLFGDTGTPSGFVGMTLPTAANVIGPDFAVIVGALPWLNELEKWGEETVSVRGAWIPSRPLERGGEIGLRLGGAAVTPNDFENLFVYARVAGWGRVPVGDGELRADLTTSYSVNDDDGFGEQFTAYLSLGAALSEASGQPGVFLRIPLDGDASEVLDASIGLTLRF